MSVKHALARGLELGRSLFQLGILKPAGRVAGKFRGERVRVPQSGPGLGVQPRAFLPARYRYYRTSLRGVAAQLQSARFRRIIGGSPRNRAVFLAFGVGLGLIDQQLEEDRRSASTCQQIQALFQKKKFPNLNPVTSGYKLEDYIIGKQIGKGCNAAVYEASAPFAPIVRNTPCSLVELKPNEEQQDRAVLQHVSHTSQYPLAVKMIWNFAAGSSSEAILSSMSQELVPAGPRALRNENEKLVLNGHFGTMTKRVSAHQNIICVYRAFTAEVPLLPGAMEEYPAALPTRLNPDGFGFNKTLFLVMKSYPCTLRQYLQGCVPGRRWSTMMLLQLLEGVDHLCKQGVAHRDLKSDNILLEFDSDGCPRLVISDFGCCLAEEDLGLKLPYNSLYVNKGGNSCLMAPEVATAVPGPGVTIDYSKADTWAVGAIAYEIFGEPNPFYGAAGLRNHSYQEKQLPSLSEDVPAHVKLVVRLLLCRNPKKRPSARVAANILHFSLWGKRAFTNLNPASIKQMTEWLLCQSAAVLLKRRCASSVEDELQRGFLASLDLEELCIAMGYLIYGRGLATIAV